MARKQGFKMTAGVYYFNVSAGYKSNITIFRKTREEAEYAYSNYIKQHKNCEWLGQWDGKKFIDSTFKTVA